MRFKQFITYGLILFAMISCGRNENRHLKILNKNLNNFNNSRTIIESKYEIILTDSVKKRERVVFVDCENEQKLSNDYVCDDKEVIEIMKDLNLSEIRFEKKVSCKEKVFSEIYFQEKKVFHYPIVYFLYEYCGTTEKVETQTIFYKPINDNWSLYIDSNFP